ncbi:hypothetical protein [uncultured Mycolicibacterium sp.]|uniref:hypothetical protein n=1 Tax=uncultured Mycolicibacterium sp. TaxID=2320817 RepID=UPI002606A1EF|nr:hypothetical protein [uncultured Mycolicibacterium sp.]
MEQRVTYRRICEPLCGLIATVEDGRLEALAGMAVLNGVPVRPAPGGGHRRGRTSTDCWMAAHGPVSS